MFVNLHVLGLCPSGGYLSFPVNCLLFFDHFLLLFFHLFLKLCIKEINWDKFYLCSETIYFDLLRFVEVFEVI